MLPTLVARFTYGHQGMAFFLLQGSVKGGSTPESGTPLHAVRKTAYGGVFAYPDLLFVEKAGAMATAIQADKASVCF